MRTAQSTGATRKEENPFSFRHFLKRDLSLPGTSTYESTGARPKVYASTVQHSPTRPDAARDPQAKEKSAEPRACDSTSSNHPGEVSHSVVDNSECEREPYAEPQPYRAGPEPPGMPSLPDFVQDHILVEQAYLNSNGPISVDLDNLPDFTTRPPPAPAAPAPAPAAPLDLPPGAEGAPAPDVALSLDLTESVNPADRRNVSPRGTFPLDLPPNAGAESMRLPDFLPVHPGRTSPEPEPDLQPLLQELERTRSELNLERRQRLRLEEELRTLQQQHAQAQAQALQQQRRRAADARAMGDDAYRESPESESSVNQLRIQIRRLKEELAAAQAEVRALRGGQTSAAADLRSAADVAEASLRDLLAGLEQLRSLSRALEPA
ncbi:ensconsin-like [Leguminivora glycinivorella]|uniref:ensconsin-like n=1 Tax=Leguminivora glycinivorella TaxID=1035111 RepID=UPI00200F81B4|nr:ensconsin-like [Leguminivora glycinivorella]